MKNILLILLCSAVLYPIFGQQSQRTTLISAWKDSTDLNLGYNDVWGYTNPTGDEYAILGSKTKINFINISNPAQPYSVSKHTGGDNTTWRDMKTYEHYAYTICDSCSEGMHIFDLSTLPDTATHVNQITEHFGRAHNIYIEGSRLYVVGMIGSMDLLIYDLANDPVNPTLLASVDLDIILGTNADQFYIHDIYVKGHTAYASHGYKGYFIWDVADPQNIQLIADNAWGGYNHSSWVSECGQYAYVAEEVPKGLPIQVVDLSQMDQQTIPSVNRFIDNIGIVGSNGLNVTHHNPFVKSDLLYISNYEDGLKIYDIREPDNPVLWAYYDSYTDDENIGTYSGYNGVWGTYPYLPSGLILSSDRKYGLQVIEVDPFDCDSSVKIIGVETTNQNQKYSCCIITGLTSRIDSGVQSKYTAQNYIHLGENFEVEFGAQVLFDIEECR